MRGITLTSTARPPVRKTRGHMLQTRSARRSGEGDDPATPMPTMTGVRAWTLRDCAPSPGRSARLSSPSIFGHWQTMQNTQGDKSRRMAGRLLARVPSRRSERRPVHHPISPNLPGRERSCLAGVLAADTIGSWADTFKVRTSDPATLGTSRVASRSPARPCTTMQLAR